MEKQIRTDYINAVKNKDQTKKSTLSLLINEINKESKTLQKTLTDEEVLKIIQKEVKKRNQSIDSYVKGNRQDLADKENDELEVLKNYLPKPLTKEELFCVVESLFNNDPTIIRGKLIGLTNKEVNGKATITEIQTVVDSFY